MTIPEILTTMSRDVRAVIDEPDFPDAVRRAFLPIADGLDQVARQIEQDDEAAYYDRMEAKDREWP